MIDQGVATALAVRDALRSTNGNDSHNSGTGVRRTERATRECTYTDFLKCQPLHFKGTEGVASLSQWFERMESVFHISNCAAENQNTGQVYTAASGEKKEHAGTIPLCNKCKFHHNGQCTIKYANYKRVGRLTRDCRSPAAINNHRNPTCYECGNQEHYKSDCPELKNQDHGNQVGGTGAHGMVHVLKGGETNQDPNDMEDDINA
nr:hypothetical protein [Tanacetum cinerariifolium]GFB43391.1 hypothetical protein [Tanacetum cinerariifolium]